jgi:hypothetical protein
MSDTEQLPAGTTLYHCPLCEWTHAELPMSETELITSLGDPVLDVARRRAMAVEVQVASHLSTHPLAEWAREVTRLRDELGKARNRSGVMTATDYRRQFSLQQLARDRGRDIMTGGSGWRGSRYGAVRATYPEGSRPARRDSWRCHHDHPDTVSALECALGEVRRLDGGGSYEPCSAGPGCRDADCRRD